MTQKGVIVVGAGATGLRVAQQLVRADISDFLILEQADDRGVWPANLDGHLRSGRKVISSVFDDDTGTWTLTTSKGERYRGRVVIAACGPMHLPWIPNMAGREEFGGSSFHSAAWDSDFDPVGKRIAVVGGDSTCGQFLDRLVASAASVQVFGFPPRRVVPVLAGRRARVQRWLSGHGPGARPRAVPQLMSSPIDALSGSGVRTRDGACHRVDTIIYGTGFSIPADFDDESLVGARGRTIQQAWHDGMEPYAGVAVPGFPNYFLAAGPNRDGQVRYAVECVQLMNRTVSTRIEVRHSTHQVFNERVNLKGFSPQPPARAFDLSPSAAAEDRAYDGAATLMIADTCQQVRVRLTGHLDPLDGRYHWQGTVFSSLPAEVLKRSPDVTLAVGECSAAARITEHTPWQTYSIAGVGAPPFPLAEASSTH